MIKMDYSPVPDYPDVENCDTIFLRGQKERGMREDVVQVERPRMKHLVRVGGEKCYFKHVVV